MNDVKDISFTDMLNICKDLRIDTVSFGFNKDSEDITLTIYRGDRIESVRIFEKEFIRAKGHYCIMKDLIHKLIQSIDNAIIDRYF